MRMKVSMQPIDSDGLSAIARDYHIPVPGLLMKGQLFLDTGRKITILSSYVNPIERKKSATYAYLL